MTPEDKNKARLEFLKADFVATKAEISRRSDLQRVASIAYYGAVGFIVPRLAGGCMNGLLVCALWCASVVA